MNNFEKSFSDIAIEIENAEESRLENKAEDIETDPELKELMECSKKINEAMGKFDSTSFIEPMGEGARSYDEEFNAFFERIKAHLDENVHLSDEEYSKMCPTFTYPNIDHIDENKLEESAGKIKDLKESILNGNASENAAKIIEELLLLSEAKIDFYRQLKKGNLDKAFERVKVVYGNADDDLCKKANDEYKNKLDFLKNRPEKSESEKKLEEVEFNAQSIRTILELSIIKGGLSDGGYKVMIDKNVTNVLVSTNYPNYDCPVVLIPPSAEKNGIQLIELAAHEIGRHVTTNIYNKKQGFGGSIGSGWDAVNEGMAKRNETKVAKEILGDDFCEFEISAEPYYILAMEKIRGEKDSEGKLENGWNYAKVFKYIYNLSLEEYLSDNGYYKLKDGIEDANNEENVLDKSLSKIKEKSEKKAIKTAKKVCLRTFKGFDPKLGGKYFPKDKIYFEGESRLLELEKAGSLDRFEKYLHLSKVDPKFIPYLIKMGAYSYEKGLEIAKDVAKEIWKSEDLPIKETMKGNNRYELFLPYLSEFMEKYYKDELYNLYDKNGQNSP